MQKIITKILFTIAIISLGLIGCNFSYNSGGENSSESGDTYAIDLSKKALKYISENNRDSLNGLINSDVLKKAKPEQLEWLIREGQEIIKNYIYPDDTSLIISKSVNYSLTGKKVIENMSFPFQSKIYKDSLKYFHITVSDNEIYRLTLNDYPPGLRFVEPERKPHLSNFNLQTDNIIWFRIWYADGAKIDKEYGNKRGYWVVSGDKDYLTKIGVKKKFQEVFNLINTAEFDSLDYKLWNEDENGDPEYIYLRFKFNNKEYEDMGEFTIYYILDEEDGKKEILSDYIVFKHSGNRRYKLLKEKNPIIVKMLKEIAHYNYSGYYED